MSIVAFVMAFTAHNNAEPADGHNTVRGFHPLYLEKSMETGAKPE